jgi:hypothetical protein
MPELLHSRPRSCAGSILARSRGIVRSVVTGAALGIASPLHAVPPEVAPSFEWASSAGGPRNDKTRCIAVDIEGNVFLAGEATDDGKAGKATVKSAGGMDFFIAKLDPNGQFLWAHTGGGALVDRGYGVATDAAGGCYVTGHYQSTDADFCGTKLVNRGGYDLFVAKYDRDGNLAWIRSAWGTGYDHGHGIAVDARGDIVVTGAVVGDADFGEAVVTSVGSNDLYGARLKAK